MVHQQFDAFRVGIVVQCFQVEVGVGRHKVEDVALPHVGPVFPTHVPAFYQHLVESVLGSEVNVAAHLLVVGGMAAVGLHLLPVNSVSLSPFFQGKT